MKHRTQPEAHLRARRLATREDDNFDSAPLRELLQRLMATEEALATLRTGAADLAVAQDPVLAETREMVLRQQAALVRELRRRRSPTGRSDGPTARAASAAWPPPPW